VPTDTPTAFITGRVCGGMYDVVHVTIQLDIDEAKLEQVLNGLTSKRLLTITRVEVTPIDGPDELFHDFIYGNQACVHLTIDLEDLFLRSWIDKYKPAGINAAISAGREPAASDAPGQ
jgi:hypothetical protein